MELSSKSARELYEIVKADRSRRRFGFGCKPALVNVDLQNAYTRPDEFPTAYETDLRQIEYVNALAKQFRAKDCPVIWTYVAYLESGEDCGVWGTRSDTSDSLQNIKEGSRRAPPSTSAARSALATSSSTSAWPRPSSRPTSARCSPGTRSIPSS
jgi:maleamate amidohydrolase